MKYLQIVACLDDEIAKVDKLNPNLHGYLAGLWRARDLIKDLHRKEVKENKPVESLNDGNWLYLPDSRCAINIDEIISVELFDQDSCCYVNYDNTQVRYYQNDYTAIRNCKKIGE